MGVVYLAGGIAGLTGAEARRWRDTARECFQVYGLEVRDPMRDSWAFHDDYVISPDFNDYKNLSMFLSSRAIMSRNFNDIRQSEVLLVNLLGAPRPSLGTVMELGWAYALQKPTVVVMENSGNPHDAHPMICEATDVRVSNLADGIRAVAVLLGKR